MNVTLPLVLLGYDLKRLFSVCDSEGCGMLPVFTEPEVAESYRRHFSSRQGMELQAYILQQPDSAINLMECISIVDPSVKLVIIDPKPDGSDSLSATLDEFIQYLKARYRPQTDDSHRCPRKPK